MNRRDFLKMGVGGMIGLSVIPFMKPFKQLETFASGSEPEHEHEYSVYLPDEKPFGISMEEWTHRYWDWYLSFSKNNNINKDRGKMIMASQPSHLSPMFFIPSAGSYEEEYEPQLVRHLKVDHRQGLFFNVLATIADLTDIPHMADLYKRISGSNSLPSAIYKNRSPEGILHYISKLDMDYTKAVLVTLNGEGLPYYRIHSTKSFPIVYAVDNIPGYPAGPTMAIQDGFWVFIKPLKEGHYNLLIKSEGTHVGMHNPEDNYRKNILNHIEVV